MITFTSRLARFAAMLAVSAVTVPAAHADMIFRNDTGRPIHFETSCNGAGTDAWTVAPYGSRSIYCTNGSPAAAVRIRTDHGSYETVVRSTVWDGNVYELGYDGDGDVNIRHG